MNTTSLRRLPLGLAALLACGLLAACGSSSNSSSTASGSTTTASSGSSTTTSRTALRNCLKAHGVTLPARRPGSGAGTGAGGGFFGGGGGAGGAFANNPKLRAAFQACGGSRFRGAGARRFRFSGQTLTAFVTCIRQHGFPAMPNPNTSGGPVFPNSIRTNPKFVTALKSCQSLLRPTAPPPGSGA